MDSFDVKIIAVFKSKDCELFRAFLFRYLLKCVWP
jgi:hypothetical protein